MGKSHRAICLGEDPLKSYGHPGYGVKLTLLIACTLEGLRSAFYA